MKLERQVTSLDLSKKLKELGVKQESLHRWLYVEAHDDFELDNGREETGYSAFTVAELGEMLPRNIKIPNAQYPFYSLQMTKTTSGKHYVGYGAEEIAEISSTEADARAKMLIYLLKHKLITL